MSGGPGAVEVTATDPRQLTSLSVSLYMMLVGVISLVAVLALGEPEPSGTPRA